MRCDHNCSWIICVEMIKTNQSIESRFMLNYDYTKIGEMVIAYNAS